MVYKISSIEDAERILRLVAQLKPAHSFMVFDIDEGLSPLKVPLVFRRCEHSHEPGQPNEYLGWNIWGYGPERASTYCPTCGYAMRALAQVDIAVWGCEVTNTSWRPVLNHQHNRNL